MPLFRSIQERLPVRFGPLDGLRGIAVLLVFLSHTSGRGMMLHPALNFQGIGHVGVYLFFCLSAYLLGSRLLDSNIGKVEIKRFFVKRIFRIWPLYFSVLIIVLVIQNVFDHYNPKYLFITPGLLSTIQHFVFYRGDGVFWSVVAEEQFYLIVPFLLLCFQKWPKVLFTLCAGIVMVNFALYVSKNVGFPVKTDFLKYISTNARNNGNYLDVFLGSFMFLFVSRSFKKFFSSKKFMNFSSILFIMTLVLTLMLVSENFLGMNQPFYKLKYLSLFFVVGFMPFIISLEYGNPAGRLLNIGLLKRIGLFGFSFYLLHMLVFEFINTNLNVRSEMKFFIAFFAVYFVSFVMFSLIEKPFIKIGYYLSRKIN